MHIAGIHTMDLHYLGTPGSIAAYVVVGEHGPVLIETGPASTTDALERGLADLGFDISDVRHALVSHIHLDHAAAAGWVARHGARIYVHEFGAKHLVNPSRLIASATRIYGDMMQTMWGTIEAVPESQVVALHDGDDLDLGGVRLSVIETPGHARHHHAFAMATDEGSVCFTGDAAATHLEGSEFISLPTPPPEFDLDRWLASLDRIEQAGFVRLYPTHFGAVCDVCGHLERVREQLIVHSDLVRTLYDAGHGAEEIHRRYRDWMHGEADRLGVPADRRRFFVSDAVARMNVAGMLRWLDRTAAR